MKVESLIRMLQSLQEKFPLKDVVVTEGGEVKEINDIIYSAGSTDIEIVLDF